MTITKNQTKRIFYVLIILLHIFSISGCKDKETSTAKNYAINYEIQGYIFKQTDEGRMFVENAIFTVRNPSLPPKMKDGEMNGDKTAFEYLYLRGFPLIENETALSTYTRDVGNGLMEVHITKSGGIRSKETGEIKLIVEAQYILFIDKETNELLLCQVFAEMDGENQQYFFSPSSNPEHINDILIKAYTS